MEVSIRNRLVQVEIEISIPGVTIGTDVVTADVKLSRPVAVSSQCKDWYLNDHSNG